MKLPVPLTNMAVSLSGGGYRATAFHLGALSLLDSIPLNKGSVLILDTARNETGGTLLENVKILSTISGGTLTGVMYALMLAEGKDFKACYHKLYGLLEADTLVGEALKKLNVSAADWQSQTYKNHNLINAFSLVYNEQFYDGATFEKLDNIDEISHLTDVIFGASEFTTGFPFRFQKPSGAFGNGSISISQKVANSIRLADAAAASSCFPGGFEPLVMPVDFTVKPITQPETGSPVLTGALEQTLNRPATPLEIEWDKKNTSESTKGKYPPTAIMDGGILDNRGIDGVLRAEDRFKTKNKVPLIGTYIISDVSGKEMQPYAVPTMPGSRFKDYFSLNRVNLIAAFLLVISLALVIFLPSTAVFRIIQAIAAGIASFVVLWFILFFFIRGIISDAVSESLDSSGMSDIPKNLKVILRAPIRTLFHLVYFRGTSTLKMVTDVFLRRINYIQKDALYDKEDWKYRMVENEIFFYKTVEGIPDEMKTIVANANKMPTALWFPEEKKKGQMLKDLVACGQFTLCSKLRNYLEGLRHESNKKVWDSLDERERMELEALKQLMAGYWEDFKKDPYWMVEKYKNIPVFGQK